MWFVIGALVVGAGIILIMNKTFPQLFASVVETFEEKADNTTQVVDGIYPITYENELMNSDFSNGLYGWAVNGTASVETVDGRTVAKIGPGDWPSGGGIHQSPIFETDRAAKITFDVRAVSDTAHPYFGFLNTTESKIVTVSEEWETVTLITKAFDISAPGGNIFHIYSNYTEFYVDNVSVVAM